jgi:hypothetical protein
LYHAQSPSVVCNELFQSDLDPSVGKVEHCAASGRQSGATTIPRRQFRDDHVVPYHSLSPFASSRLVARSLAMTTCRYVTWGLFSEGGISHPSWVNSAKLFTVERPPIRGAQLRSAVELAHSNFEARVAYHEACWATVANYSQAEFVAAVKKVWDATGCRIDLEGIFSETPAFAFNLCSPSQLDSLQTYG